MVDKISSWKYAEEYPKEPAVISRARKRADEMGIESITASTGSHLQVLVSALKAKAIVEVGTGAGVSGLWMLLANDSCVLATIETESEYQELAKLAFDQAGIASSRLRLINGKSSEVLANLADAAYDLVLLDGDKDTLLKQVSESFRLLRPGGVLAIAHALWRDRVPDNGLADETTMVYRNVLDLISNSEEFIATLSPIGDGLLLATKRG